MVITLGGTYGSGGKAIAASLKRLLGWRLCDDAVFSEAAKAYDTKLTEDTLRYFDESEGKAPLSELMRLSGPLRKGYALAVRSMTYDVLPLDREMDRLQREVITSLAEDGDCIFMGRCADHYLAGREDLLSVYTVDTEDNCILRIQEAFPQLSRKEALRLKKKTDKRRGDYYQYFTGKAWGDMNSYAMMLNCSAVGGAEIAAELLTATALSQAR
jgi:cytidylate kinase